MTKSKSQKSLCVPQRHLHSRLSFLYQAATHLANFEQRLAKPTSTGFVQPIHSVVSENPEPKTYVQDAMALGLGSSFSDRDPGTKPPATSVHGFSSSRQLLSHLRAVSLKAQIRLSPSIKNVICKHCQTLLVVGSNAHQSLENLSRGGRKPWADVIVLRCHTCGTEKRTPVGAKRQTRRAERCNNDRTRRPKDMLQTCTYL